jgi:hypothetical protein
VMIRGKKGKNEAVGRKGSKYFNWRSGWKVLAVDLAVHLAANAGTRKERVNPFRTAPLRSYR